MVSATIRRRAATGQTSTLTPARRRFAVGWAIAFVLLMAVALATGMAFVFTTPNSRSTASTTATNPQIVTATPTDLSDRQRQDALAAATMPTLPAAAANPHALLPGGTVATLPIPAATHVDGLVRTGFPRTPGGAIAQLAAIDEAAIDGMNPAQVMQVYADWATSGADPVDQWSVSQFVNRTLTVSGIPNGSSQLQASFTVTEAQVKGTVGDDFVLACVNGEFDASLSDNTVRIGAADCARMMWTGNRWQIGPGSQPASPPDAWPGTAEAAQAGWRPITDD